jgi:hypothetical protein
MAPNLDINQVDIEMKIFSINQITNGIMKKTTTKRISPVDIVIDHLSGVKGLVPGPNVTISKNSIPDLIITMKYLKARNNEYSNRIIFPPFVSAARAISSLVLKGCLKKLYILMNTSFIEGLKENFFSSYSRRPKPQNGQTEYSKGTVSEQLGHFCVLSLMFLKPLYWFMFNIYCG